MRRFLAYLFVFLAYSMGAWAQCTGGLLVNCPAAVNPQPGDLVYGWQLNQVPHSRSFTLNELGAAAVGATFAAPPPIGSITPNTGAFTTLSVSGGASLAGTITGTPTFSGNLILSGNPTLSGNPVFSGSPVFDNNINVLGTYEINGITAVSAATNTIALGGATSIDLTLGPLFALSQSATTGFTHPFANTAGQPTGTPTVTTSPPCDLDTTDAKIWCYFGGSWQSVGGGGGSGTPGGTNNQIQYNSSGAFAGISIVDSAVLSTNGSGVPALSTTLPSGLTIPGYALLGTAQSFTATQSVTPSSISISGSTFTPTAANSNNFSFTLSHTACPCTIANPSGTLTAGTSGAFIISEDSTGGAAIGTWGTDYVTPSGGITLNTTANAVTVIPFFVTGSSQIMLGGTTAGGSGGAGTVNTGAANDLAYYSGAGNAVSGLTTAASGVLVTDINGVPSISSSLPSGLTIPGYLNSSTVTLSGDVSGAGAASITTTVGSVDGVAYPASPAANTVPVVTGTNQVTYEQIPSSAIAATVTAGSCTNCSLTYNAAGQITLASSGGAGGGGGIAFFGVPSFSSNAYTISSTVPSGFTLTNGYMVSFYVGSGDANTGAATLAIDSTTAEPIEIQAGGATSALTGGELQASSMNEAIYSTACTCYILQPPQSSQFQDGATTQTLTASQFAVGTLLVPTTASQTFTLPSTAPNGVVYVAPSGVSATVTAPSGASINGASAGSITVPSGAEAMIEAFGNGSYLANGNFNVGSGTSGQVAAYSAGGTSVAGTSTPNLPSGGAYEINGSKVPSILPVSIGWVAGANPNNASIVADLPATYTINSIVFREEAALGATGTIAVYVAPSGTACGSGTDLSGGTFNANGTAATNQTLSLTTTSVPSGDSICLQTTGTWSSGSSVGTITVYMNPS